MISVLEMINMVLREKGRDNGGLMVGRCGMIFKLIMASQYWAGQVRPWEAGKGGNWFLTSHVLSSLSPTLTFLSCRFSN